MNYVTTASTTATTATTLEMRYRMDLKEYAQVYVKKFYNKGYITSSEAQAMLHKLDTIEDDHSAAIAISINVEGREILFNVGFETANMTVFTQQNEIDFAVNYSYRNDTFWIDEPNLTNYRGDYDETTRN